MQTSFFGQCLGLRTTSDTENSKLAILVARLKFRPDLILLLNVSDSWVRLVLLIRHFRHRHLRFLGFSGQLKKERRKLTFLVRSMNVITNKMTHKNFFLLQMKKLNAKQAIISLVLKALICPSNKNKISAKTLHLDHFPTFPKSSFHQQLIVHLLEI